MKLPVKSIRIFREFFKSNIRESNDPKRNPHFAGHSLRTEQGNIYGFFDLYHGLKPDIENLLKTILEMARDSQALYEFMQNAVDQESSDFMLFHHRNEEDEQDYLVVVNNGHPFDLRGVLAILNIAASNKYRDPDSIGQFGVGFKLAHRLVGEEEGLKALMEENKGPILFSWENGELEKLALTESFQYEDPCFEGVADDAVCGGNEPWLFKILYTNFPCQPDDIIIDVNEKTVSDVFSVLEARALREAAQKCLAAAVGKNYSQGALFLIPLHPAKITELTQDAARYGLEISTAILNRRSGKHKELSRIILNGVNLDTLETEAETFRFTDLPAIFDGIKILEIDFLYGDPLNGNDPFAGKPQFYLYFPMTEERHGFRFAVHSNAFSFTSARTALQDKSEKNRAIFEMLLAGLRTNLQQYAQNDKERFERLYSSFLLSQPGENGKWKENREWLEEYFWSGLMKLILDFTPVVDGKGSWRLAEPGEKIVIKASTLPLEEWYSADIAWFYWNDRGNTQELCRAAENKLRLLTVNLIDVLEDPNCIARINKWVSEIENGTTKILEELDQTSYLFTSRKEKAKGIYDNIAYLELWTFDTKRYSIEQLSKPDLRDHLLSYGPLTELEDLLDRAGFRFAKEKLGQFDNIDIRDRNEGRLPYLKNYKELNIVLSRRFILEDIFSPAEKQRIFNSITKAIRDSAANVANVLPDRMKVLAIFANVRGEIKPMDRLLQISGLPTCLNEWHVRQGDIINSDISLYTASTNEAGYEQVILPLWNDISDFLKLQTHSVRVEGFSAIAAIHAQKPSMENLPSKMILFAESELPESAPVYFYHPSLATFSKDEYAELDKVFGILKMGVLPQYSLLRFYTTKPFILQPDTDLVFTIDSTPLILTVNQACVLVKLCQRVNEARLSELIFSENINGSVNLIPRTLEMLQCLTDSKRVQDYILKYHSENLQLLPSGLHNLGNYISLKGDVLITYLIGRTSREDENLRDIIELLKTDGTLPHKKTLLSKIAEGEPIVLKEKITLDDPLTSLFRFSLEITDKAEQVSLIGQILGLSVNDKIDRLNTVQHRGSDQFTVEGTTKVYVFSVSAVVGENKSNAINEILTKCAKNWAEMGNVGSMEEIEATLGVYDRRKSSDILGELLNTLQNSSLKNAHQLAFVLAMSEQNENILDRVNVLTKSGVFSLQGNAFYEDAHGLNGFIPSELLMDDCYKGCLDLLEIPEKAYYQSGQSFILKRPFIVSGEFFAPGLNQLPAVFSAAMLSYLFTLWNTGERAERLSWRGGTDKWSELLGFDPKTLMLDTEWQTVSEEVEFKKQRELLTVDEGLSVSFLKALGGQAPGGIAAQWRKFFAGMGTKPFEQLYAGNAVSTLKWLAAKALFIDEENLIHLYAPVFFMNAKQLPLPIYQGENDRLIISFAEGSSIQTISKADLIRAEYLKIRPSAFSSVAQVCIVPEIPTIGGLWQSITDEYPAAEIVWDIASVRNLAGKEWDQPWYKDWSEEFNAKIFIISTEIPREVHINNLHVEDYFWGQAIMVLKDSYEIYVKHDLSTRSAIEVINHLYDFPTKIALALQSAYESHHSYMSTLLEKIQDQEVYAELQRQLAEAARTQERQDAATRLQDSDNWYTMQWFADLLELVKKQESILSSPAVEFEHIRLLPGFVEVYELSGASTLIPSNIEDYQSITATIYYIDSLGKSTYRHTHIEPTQKHQKLWVRFPDVTIKQILQEKIRSVKITFARTTDLIQALKQGFNSLGYAPDHNLKATLSPNIRFIFGPPGTGKTTEVATRIISIMAAERNGPIVVLTPTNKAADVLTHKIISKLDGLIPAWLSRFGTCNDPSLLKAGVVAGNDIVVNGSSSMVLITTIHRFPYSKVRIRNADVDTYTLCDVPWGLVIFDEASMIPLPYAAFAIHKRTRSNPDTQFLIAGDPLQIPPVFDLAPDDIEAPDNAEELQKQNIYTMVGLSSFDPDEQALIPVYGENNRIDNLPVQHRSIPLIGELFSKFQYGGRLKHSRGTTENKRSGISRPLPDFLVQLGFKPITIIRYQVAAGDSIYNPKKLNKSPLHIQSSLLVNELLKKFNAEISTQRMDKWTVGVISPYRAQASLMARMIESSLPYNERLTISVDTVHGFQGDENELVIAVLNPSSENASRSRFLKESHILNVAISRSEDYLVLFIPDEDTKGLTKLPLIHDSYPNSILGILRSLPQDNIVEIKASALEEALMNDGFYFEKHTRTTAHLPVNVYGTPQTPYLFRLSANAVDLHWHH